MSGIARKLMGVKREAGPPPLAFNLTAGAQPAYDADAGIGSIDVEPVSSSNRLLLINRRFFFPQTQLFDIQIDGDVLSLVSGKNVYVDGVLANPRRTWDYSSTDDFTRLREVRTTIPFFNVGQTYFIEIKE